MDSVERLEHEVEFWSRYNSELSKMLEGLQKEKARATRILQQKRAELARLKQVRITKARRLTAI